VNVQFNTGAPVNNPQNGTCTSAAAAGTDATRPHVRVNKAATKSFLIREPSIPMGPAQVELNATGRNPPGCVEPTPINRFVNYTAIHCLIPV
jgi:hypothetical protein